MIDLYLLSVLFFFGILAVLIYRDRKNIDVKYVLFMRRTKKFRDVLDRIAQRSVTFWKIFGTIGFLVALFFMVQSTYSIVNVAYLVFTGAISNPPGVQIALPIPSSQMTVGPGFIGIPFWFWIIAVAIILIPHEAMHGIIARAEKIRLKDVGLMLLAIFPGAFVEPDEKQLEKSKLITKLRIFSAGTFINILIGFFIVLLVQSLLWAPNINGLTITSVNQTSPAGLLGLKPGMVLQSIGGRSASISFYDYSLIELMVPNSNTQNVTQVLSSTIVTSNMLLYKPGDTVTLKIDGAESNVTLGENPNYKGLAYIGIGTKLNVANAGLFDIAFPLLGLVAILSILVGAFNILPIYPLDGGLVVKAIADRYLKKKNSSRVTLAITFVLLALIIYFFLRGFF
jgi:membrane-associated protease RseP (regulator of RpoE activity)